MTHGANDNANPIQLAMTIINDTITSYFKLGDDFELHIMDGNHRKNKDVATERIIDTIDKLEKEAPDDVLDIYRKGWIYIYKDILLKRRFKKIIKIKNNINVKH